MKNISSIIIILLTTLFVSGCEKCFDFKYVYLVDQEALITIDEKTRPFKRVKSSDKIPIKYKLVRDNYYIIFKLASPNTPSIHANAFSNEGVIISLAGKDAIKMNKGGYFLKQNKMSNGSFEFNVVYNDKTLGSERIKFKTRTSGEHCIIDSL